MGGEHLTFPVISIKNRNSSAQDARQPDFLKTPSRCFVFFFIAPKAKPFVKSRIELEARSKVSFEFCLLEFVPLG